MQQEISNLKLIVSVVEESRSSKVRKAVGSLKLLSSTVVLAHGTVRNKIMNLLGITDRRKDVCIMIVKESEEKAVYDNFESKFNLQEHGHGIAFSVPLTRVMLPGLLIENEAIVETKSKRKGVDTMGHEAIMTIADHGKSDEIIAAAKAKGATGGTLIHARGLANPNNPKLFGMDIEPEKDVVLILAPTNLTEAIMDNIMVELGIDEPNSGIIFTVDVTKTMGLFK